MKPLSNWETGKTSEPNLVWWGQTEERFLIEVHRTNLELATLIIFDHTDGDRVLHQEEVSLSFGAVLGPDIRDVLKWEDRAIEMIDLWKMQNAKI